MIGLGVWAATCAAPDAGRPRMRGLRHAREAVRNLVHQGASGASSPEELSPG